MKNPYAFIEDSFSTDSPTNAIYVEDMYIFKERKFMQCSSTNHIPLALLFRKLTTRNRKVCYYSRSSIKIYAKACRYLSNIPRYALFAR